MRVNFPFYPKYKKITGNFKDISVHKLLSLTVSLPNSWHCAYSYTVTAKPFTCCLFHVVVRNSHYVTSIDWVTKDKGKVHLWTSRTAHRRSRGIALLFLDHGTRRGWGVSVTPWPLFTPGKDPEAGWVPGPVWTGAENLAPPPPGFDLRTVQPVASRYTDCATTGWQMGRYVEGNGRAPI